MRKGIKAGRGAHAHRKRQHQFRIQDALSGEIIGMIERDLLLAAGDDRCLRDL